MFVTVKKLGIRFIDSLNFLPMKLAKLLKAMSFELCKGVFPLFKNSAQSWDYSRAYA